MRGRSRRKKRTGKMVSLQKRFLAFMLAFAMIFTNVGTDLHVSFAASGNRVDFTIGGSDLVGAIRQAIEDENVVSQDSLDFTDGATEKFEALFFGDGKVYEVYPDIQGDSMEAELRVFVKLPADADDTYMVTGEEEVYFLYVNNGEDTISCSTTVTRTENGKEKEKTTKRITIKSYEDKFGDEERNIISKPVETAPAETVPEEKPTEAVTGETTENVVNPTDEEKETTVPEETAEVPETKNDVEESKEQVEESKAEETKAATEAAEETDAAEPETDAETEAEPETEASEAEVSEPAKGEAETENIASISRHAAPLVAMKEEVAAADAVVEIAEPQKPEAEAPKAEETEKASEVEQIPETAAVETVEETTAVETLPAKETVPEEGSTEETTAADQKEEPATEETKASEEVTEETTAAETTAEEPDQPETLPAQTDTAKPVQPAETTAPTEPTPAPQPEEPVKKAETADDGDLVGIGYCSTAKVYKSTLNDLRVFGSETVFTAEVMGADGVTVKLSASDGVLPENGYVEAVAVDDADQLELMKEAADETLKEENRRVTDIFAADIILYNEDGEAVQPDGSVKVTFDGTGIGNSGTRVLYMGESDSDTESFDAQMIKAVTTGDDATAFMTDHFSLYAAVDTEEITCYKVNFYYKDAAGNVVLISGPQYVEEGKAAQAPAAPDREGYEFTGWNPATFSEVTDNLDVYAQYVAIAGQVRLTVNYVYSDGTMAAQPWVSHVKSGVACDLTAVSPEIAGFEPDQEKVSFDQAYTEDQTVTVTYTGAEVRYTVKHYLLNVDDTKPADPAWTETLPGETGLTTQAVAREYEGFTPLTFSQAKINADGNTVVEILYERNYYTLTWDTGDNASYIASEQLRYGAAITAPANDPTRVGYDFKGWEGLQDQTTMPAKNLVVTAKWEAAKSAAYKIVYWTETVTEGFYTVNKVVNGNDTVGKSIPDGKYTVPEGYETTPVADKTDKDVKITADGMAVKNVYYKRATYTIKFWRWEVVESGWLWEKKDWVEDTKLRITARYGVDVSAQWEEACKNQTGWGPSEDDSIQYTLLANMPAKNLDMYQKQSGKGKYIIYYVEGLDGERKEYRRFEADSGVWLTDEDKMPINGFEFKNWYQGSKWNPWNSGNLWLYYTRKSYPLFFENCQSIDPVYIKFEAKLSTGRPSGEPGRPANVEDDYTFEGWYLDPGFKEPVVWDQTMTDAGLTVYAKWAKPEYTVTFETNGAAEKESITREKGFILSETDLAAPEKENDEFLGWYTDEALTKKFVPESKIVKDTTLYARWKNSDTVTYTVRYMYGETEIAKPKQVTVPRDSQISEDALTIDGYYPETLSLGAKITQNGQEIIFRYKAVQSWEYTVKYRIKDTNTQVPGSIDETGSTSDQNIMITFKSFEGYTLTSDPVQKATQDEPEVIFYYVRKTAIYHVQHWYERLNGEFVLRYIDTFNTASGQLVTTKGRERQVDGFTLDTSIPGTIAGGTTNIQNVLLLKLYYTRNVHNVSYVYEGTVPAGAQAAPAGSDHKYQENVTVEPQPSPVPGYVFSGWKIKEPGNGKLTIKNGKFVMPDEDVVLTGSFEAAEQTYQVRYVDEDTKTDILPMSASKAAHFNDVIYGYKEKVDINGYTFVRATDITVGIVNDNNIVIVYYRKDANKDNIPDKYQITFTYVSADANKGTVTGTTSEVATTYEITRDSVTGEITVGNGPTAQYPTQPSTVEAKDGYKFDKWTDNAGKPFKDDAALRAESYLEDQTFTAHFTATEQTYKVKYLDEDTKEEIHAMSDPKAAHFGDVIKGYTEKIDISGYTFVRADDLTVRTDNEKNIVTVYYSKDANKDGIPDKYQITFTYVSADEDKGTVTGTTSEVVTTYEITRDSVTDEIIVGNGPTAQHPTQPSTVEAKAGYKFDKWTDEDQKSFNDDTALKAASYLEDQTFTAYFTERADLHYEIHYFYEDANSVVTEDTAAAIVSASGVFGEKILTTTVTKESEFNGKHYVLDRIIGADKRIGLDPDENIVNVYYSIDVIGKEDPDKPDNIPDKYQITFTYVSADEDKGTVTGITREVATVYEIFTDSETGEITDVGRPIPQHPTQPSTVTPKDGYRFEKWQQDDLTFFNSDDELRNSEYLEDQTFIAHFTVRRDLHYEIHYFYEDANGVVTEDKAAAIVSDSGVFGEKILTTTVPKESEFNGKNYVLERIEGADKQIGLDPKENMVNVYYSMDEIGEIDPDEPDNIPDKYQVTFQYISENPSYGTVSGKVKEVVTRPKNADGTYNMTSPVHPKAEVTVAGIGNYKFNRWSDGNTNYSAASEIAKAGFIADTTFTAYFSYSGGNSGGGSSGGGGGGSHRSTISNTSGGPGVTTTITPGDVPMAELPESPAPIVIDDGEIPMAALPKTGQTTVKAALTMMFSGIFLALIAIGRKKKEQDV